MRHLGKRSKVNSFADGSTSLYEYIYKVFLTGRLPNSYLFGEDKTLHAGVHDADGIAGYDDGFMADQRDVPHQRKTVSL